MLLKYTDETKPFLTIFASFYPNIDTFFGVFSASWVKKLNDINISHDINGKIVLSTGSGIYKFRMNY